MTGADHLDADLDPLEREMGDRLKQYRPVPSAGFRGTLARRLVSRDPGYGPRPARLTQLVAGAFAGGLSLIVLAALGAVGAL